MKTERIRDPIHDLVIFEGETHVDRAAWALLQCADLQRLRRIKQLGLSEFVFPSASHTRFAHSVGVFHNARRLVGLIEREITSKRVPGTFDERRARVAVFAALLHDIGHGPFSHAFEEARKALAVEVDPSAKARLSKHEDMTAAMINDPAGRIGELLSGAGIEPTEVAALVAAETPEDMYHAVVSSSFDADRLDYLVRDRYMTGTGAGAIDFGWLMDNVRVADIDVSPVEANGGESIYRHSFCLWHKARDAAEDFLLARYRLYGNVYLHKTTRGLEQMLSFLFRSLARETRSAGRVCGLADDHPLVRFFSPGGDRLENCRALDDTVVWGAMHAVAASGTGDAKMIAGKILGRHKPICLDVQHAFPGDAERQRRLKHELDAKFKRRLGERVFRDSAKLSLYGEIGGDDGRAQKRLMIQLPHDELREITSFKDTAIAGSNLERTFERYYFLEDADFRMAQSAVQTIRGRRA